MTVVGSATDPGKLTLTIIAEFDAEPDQVWEMWESPRKLERWWGPPTYPASFTRHDFVVGGESRYHMTGPAGDMPRGWWRMDVIDRPHRIEFANGLAGEDGEPAPGIAPATGQVFFTKIDGGTRMTAITKFVDVAQMELMLGMGMQEGMGAAISQIDGLLAATTV